MKLEQKVPWHRNILKILDLEQDYPYFAEIGTSRQKSLKLTENWQW